MGNQFRDSENFARKGKHARTGLRDPYDLRTKGDAAATTQLYEGMRPGTQQFGDQAYPFQEEQFTKDRENYPYAFGTNQYREMRESNGIRTQGLAETAQV